MSYSTISPFDHLEMLSAYNQLADKIQWSNSPGKGQQTGVQYADNEDPFLSAVGKKQKDRSETEYCLINPLFQNTIFEDIIKKYNLCRSRLLWMDRKSCYSIHKDPSPRLHIPLITNSYCMFIFLDKPQLIHLPAGNIYVVNTLKKHSFCNFSDESRLHFMGCISTKDYYKHLTSC
jgi:hypothetical protein